MQRVADMVLDLRRAVISCQTTKAVLYLNQRRNARPLVGCLASRPLSPSLLHSTGFHQPGTQSMCIIFDSSLASWRVTETTSPSLRSNHISLKLVPSTNSTRYIRSLPRCPTRLGEYPYASGTGSPEERNKAIVAASLATTKYLGVVAGYGIRTTIWKSPCMVMGKVLLNPPSASFFRSTTSSGFRPTDSAASRHSPSTLKASLRSAWQRTSLMLKMLDYALDLDDMHETYIHRPDI